MIYINKALFKSIMVLNGDTLNSLAEAMGKTRPTISHKLNETHGEFTTSEIRFIKDRYHLTIEDIDRIFFTTAVS